MEQTNTQTDRHRIALEEGLEFLFLFQQVIFLPDFSSSTVVNLRCLLYGSSLLLSKDEIKNLNLLNNLLNIHQKVRKLSMGCKDIIFIQNGLFNIYW